MKAKNNIIWYKNNVDQIAHGGELWNDFVTFQHNRIVERLNRYNDRNTIKAQINEDGGLTPYQKYKINTVGKFLEEALDRISKGKYGKCKYCNCEIPVERLLLVPAALQCVSCDAIHNK